MMLCQDSDILYFDPLVFAATVGQVIANAGGNISGTVITIPAGLTGCDLHVNQVASITGVVSGQFVITAFDSTTVTVSMLSEGYQPDDGSTGENVPSFNSSGAVQMVVRTLWPYRRTISDQLLAAAGIPLLPTGPAPTLLNPQDFKRAACLGTLAMAYNYLAADYAGQSSGPLYLARYQIYVPLFSQAMRSIRAQIDWDCDGKPDEIRYLGEIGLTRA